MRDGSERNSTGRRYKPRLTAPADVHRTPTRSVQHSNRLELPPVSAPRMPSILCGRLVSSELYPKPLLGSCCAIA